MVGHRKRQSTNLRFLYQRHFVLLTCFSVLVATEGRPLLAGNVSFCIAVYGTLHALALMLALRARQPPWRMTLFIVMAAALSVVNLQAGFIVLRLFGGLHANAALYSALGFSAMIGALAYGMLIRQFKFCDLPAAALAMISGGCLAAAYLALFLLAHFQALGRWWLAVLWWYAFSGGLWYWERRRCAERSS